MELTDLYRDQNLLTWTDSAIYVLTPHNGQVLLWTEVKGGPPPLPEIQGITEVVTELTLSALSFTDVVDIAVHRSELFCLHGSGRLSHLSLLSAERCVERLLRRESWPRAAAVCCMFQHAIATSRVSEMVLACDITYHCVCVLSEWPKHGN